MAEKIFMEENNYEMMKRESADRAWIELREKGRNYLFCNGQ